MARRTVPYQRPLPNQRPLPDQRPLPPRPASPAHKATTRARPDPTGHRLAIAFGGLATASALATVFLAPTTSAGAPDQLVTTAETVPVQHVTRYVTLQPGQTAPPNAVVAPVPAATPRTVVVTTRQSGSKK